MLKTKLVGFSSLLFALFGSHIFGLNLRARPGHVQNEGPRDHSPPPDSEGEHHASKRQKRALEGGTNLFLVQPGTSGTSERASSSSSSATCVRYREIQSKKKRTANPGSSASATYIPREEGSSLLRSEYQE
ncbi:unnamed protein product [Amoebophrya sp. A25]|nr:unnamed protein product [Amoebophrya sp. A25]|eukprot:GSA25T00022008001.1